MIRYALSLHNAQKHYIDISVKIDNLTADKQLVQIAAWRPGRYELANFAKNIRAWQVSDARGNPLKSYKITKDVWQIETGGAEEISVAYQYYANQPDAGGSYADNDMLYVNPINCLIYIEEWINDPCEIQLVNLPESWQASTAIAFSEDKKAVIKDYHTLADSPFIFASDLKKVSYKVDEYQFYIHIKGHSNPDMQKLIADFMAFSAKQIALFGDLPVKEYHFLFVLPDVKFHHGVEHLDSTVIFLGPGYKLMTELYTDFLGVSSHELFHCWNVKSIRPLEMMPYDYSRENYTTLNYVTEGVTTYYGDLMLLRSDRYSWDIYKSETTKKMDRHLHNGGKFFQTLAEASMDSWLDGYAPGAPDRKISFYLKGMIVALMLDLTIRKNTGSTKSLDTVMAMLYTRFAKENKGYTEQDYRNCIEEAGGTNINSFFDKYVHGLEPVEPALNSLLDYIGCKLETYNNLIYYECKLGMRLLEYALTEKEMIMAIAQGSPADQAKLTIGDEIIAVNGINVSRNTAEIIRLFKGKPILLTLIRNNKIFETSLIEGDQNYFQNHVIVKNISATDIQKENFKFWSHQEF